jgi:hypothetical protein
VVKNHQPNEIDSYNNQPFNDHRVVYDYIYMYMRLPENRVAPHVSAHHASFVHGMMSKASRLPLNHPKSNGKSSNIPISS